MKFIKILFFTFYTWLKNISDTAEYQAVFGICLVTFANFISIPGLIELTTGQKFNIFPILSKLTIAIILIVYFCIYYFLLLYKKKYKNILKEYVNESRRKMIQRNLLVLVYVICSILGAFLPWIILTK